MRRQMPASVRLTKEEQREIEIKCRELNKILINQEFAPIQESELIHLILKRTLSRVKVNKRGEIEVE